MDAELLSILRNEAGTGDAGLAAGGSTGHSIRFADLAAGIVEVEPDGHPDRTVRHPLKPLRDLYGPGTGQETLDPTDPTFGPLLLTVEETILRAADREPRLTDARVAATLDLLTQSPDAPAPLVQGVGDPLAALVQLHLRLTLSLNDYSRGDVRRALRTVAKSVARHSRLAGPRGYLAFIRQQLGR